MALFLTRGRTLHHLFSSGGANVNERTGLGQLDVGGVVAVGAVGDDVFTGIGDDLELVGAAAADRAGVGAHGAEHEAEAVSYTHLDVYKRQLSALMALGYSEREAQASVRALPAEVTVSEGIRLALKALAR